MDWKPGAGGSPEDEGGYGWLFWAAIILTSIALAVRWLLAG